MNLFRCCLLAGLAVASWAAGVAATQQKPGVFRGRVDLMQLDVTVLDKDGRPVRGLTKDDFTLLEDKTPQVIQAFTAIDLPDRVIDLPAWSDRVKQDVISNDVENARIFVLVIDDALSMGFLPPPARPGIPDPAAVANMKDGAEAFLKSLGPLDLAAVVFTQRTKLNQNLTADKAKLIASIRAFPPTGGGDLAMGQAACLGANYSITGMEGLVRTLGELPDRRKSIVYFGGVMPWVDVPDPKLDPCSVYWRWRDVFAAAQQASVTINPVDPMGLRVNTNNAFIDRYLAVASNTGGRAVVMSNDLKPGLEKIRIENSSYYLLAYMPTKGLEDGTFRQLTVRVKDRPDVEIVSRRNYWAPRAKPANQPAPPPPPPEIEAMSGIVPKADLKLRATAAAFAVPGAERAMVAIALGVTQPPLSARTPDNVEIIVKAFTADGDARGTDTQVIPITVPAARADATQSRYEVLARLELPRPGKYELRLSGKSSLSGTTGAIYLDVDVPDFRRARLSLSGVVLNVLPAAGPVAPPRGLADLTPMPPTTERAFTPADFVTAFVRVYQGGNDALAPVAMKIRIADAQDKPVFENTETIAPDRFAKDRAAEFQLRLPLANLKPGNYLLTLQGTLGKTVVSRELTFAVR